MPRKRKQQPKTPEQKFYTLTVPANWCDYIASMLEVDIASLCLYAEQELHQKGEATKAMRQVRIARRALEVLKVAMHNSGLTDEQSP